MKKKYFVYDEITDSIPPLTTEFEQIGGHPSIEEDIDEYRYEYKYERPDSSAIRMDLPDLR